ncbi:MAG: Clp protease N-terminal domain-containing protein, partial [Hyphomicrobium sp.]
MDYRGQDLDLRTSRWAAASTDPTGWREVASPTPSASSSLRQPAARSGPIWVDETLLACANHAYDVALAYRSAEVRLEHLMLAMTRVEAAAEALDARGVRIASLRRDCAVAIAGEAPAASDGTTPRRSPEIEDVLRLAASRASHAGRPGNVEDVAQVLAEIGGDLPGGDLITRYFPRPIRELRASA